MAAPRTLSDDQKNDIVTWFDEAATVAAKGKNGPKKPPEDADKCNYVMKKFKEKYNMKPPGPVTIGKLVEKKKAGSANGTKSTTQSTNGLKSGAPSPAAQRKEPPSKTKVSAARTNPPKGGAKIAKPVTTRKTSPKVAAANGEPAPSTNGHHKPDSPPEPVQPEPYDEPDGANSSKNEPEEPPVRPQLTVRPPTGAAKAETGPRSARPTTAKAPPRVVRKAEYEESNFADVRIEQAADTSKIVANLITENTDKDEDEEDLNFEVEQATHDDEDNLMMGSSAVDGTELKGSLVKQLMDTKKELEGNDANSSNGPSKDEPMVRLANKEIEKLRQNIQNLSRLANPLGRVLEYLQQDMDTMLSELRSWEDETSKNAEILEKERSSNESHLIPLRAALEDIEREISEEMDRIICTKANSMKNEQKLQRLLAMVVGK